MMDLLRTILRNMEFVFMPSIPNSTCRLNETDLRMGILPTVITTIVFPAITMHTSFQSLHEDIRRSAELESDEVLLMKFYRIPESFAEPRVIHKPSVRWNTPYSTVVSQSCQN